MSSELYYDRDTTWKRHIASMDDDRADFDGVAWDRNDEVCEEWQKNPAYLYATQV